MLVFLPIPAEHQAQIETLRAGIIACKGRQKRAIMAYRAERALYALLEDAVDVWANSPRPDIRPVMTELARICAFRVMLRDIPPPPRRRKTPNADQGVARDRRAARRRGSRR